MLSLIFATVVNPHATVILRAPPQIRVASQNEIVIEFKVRPHWHIYWENPGDSGEEPRAVWKADPAVDFGKLVFPIPQRLPAGPFTNFGFAAEDREGKARVIALRVPVVMSTPGPTAISLSLTYLVCKESCVPEKAELQIVVPVVDTEKAAKSGATMARLAFDDEKYPRREGKGSRVTPLTSTFTLVGTEDPRVRLKVPAEFAERDLTSLRFFPLTTPALVASQPGKPIENNKVETELEIALDSSVSVQDFPSRIQGLLVDEAKGDASWIDFEKFQPFNTFGFLKLMGLALLGGLLLNLMPCVFPIVSLKVLSFVREGHGDASEVRRHAYAYTFGVLLSLWVLVGALLVIRSAGTSIGWGFQLQNPIFLFVMLAVFFLLALNLLGVLEVNYAGPPRAQNMMMKRGLKGSFFTGLLTTVVATPCSAPFMGVAVGAALAGTTLEAFAIFTSLAIGLALPYLILAFNPVWVRVLPKSGAWMETLKEFLAFPLFLTAVWLFWVLAQMVDLGALVLVLGWCVAAGFFAWARHRRFAARARRVWISIASLALVLATGLTILAVMPTVSEDSQGWSRYSDARLQTELVAGRSVFVDFTASWCVTCQVNKRLVLMTDAGAAAFKAADVVKLRADWTKRDSEITNALSRLGRNSVPVYAFYRNGSVNPKLLPEILTLDVLKSALEEK